MLRTLRAANPSAMTHTGTMSYLLGRGAVVVIDPGPDLATHRRAILAALGPDERIVAILVTHGHADHAGGARALARASGAPVLGFGPPGSGRSAAMRAIFAPGQPAEGEGFELGHAPDRALAEGETLDFGAFRLGVLHTPGHTGCSLCFALQDWLFTGDLVMGWAPSLVAPPDGDMGDYMASLARLAAGGWARFLPGHGDPIAAPAARIAALIAHRRQREAQVLAAVAAGPADLDGLLPRVYGDVAPPLWPAARRNLLAHLIDLCGRGLVGATPAPGPAALFHSP